MSIFPKTILFYGCGNMGGAILRGWINADIPAHHFHVISPSKRAMPSGVSVYASAQEFIAAQGSSNQDSSNQSSSNQNCADMVIIGVKPHMLNGVAADIQSTINEKTLVVSILAGIEHAGLKSCFPGNQVVRMMPNLAVEIGKSPIGLMGDVNDEQRDALSAIFTHLGAPEWGADDEHISLVTAMAGCGPAYLFRFIDALSKAANDMGMDKAQALRLATMMVDGASDLAMMSDDSPRELATKVASKGGVTAVGLSVLDQDDALEHLIKKTVKAAYDRNHEMSQIK